MCYRCATFVHMKLGEKHKKIFKAIKEYGKYKPTYSDHEPATNTLIKWGLVKWNESYTGVIFTEKGSELAKTILQ